MTKAERRKRLLEIEDASGGVGFNQFHELPKNASKAAQIEAIRTHVRYMETLSFDVAAMADYLIKDIEES